MDGVCCNSACIAPANLSRTCAEGTCAFVCLEGFGNCDGSMGNDCETDRTSHTQHCCGCGQTCLGPCAPELIKLCEDGECVCSESREFAGFGVAELVTMRGVVMDHERFDDLTRVIARRLPRRTAVRALISAAVAPLALLGFTEAAGKGKKKKGGKKGKKKKKKRPTSPPPQSGCRFEEECPLRFALGRCCPGVEGLDFCFATENRDPCPAKCDGYDCPCRVDADCPFFDNGEDPPERGFCCKNCVYYGESEFGTCLPPGSDLDCIRCGQTPTTCGDNGLHACYPDEACCLNAGGALGICCHDASQCSVGPNDGLPCCNQPGCFAAGEYLPPGEFCCCGIYDSGSSGGGQICCTRERGQSCSSSAECCPDFQGDTVCRGGVCTLPGAGGSEDDCPPARPFWCPPDAGRPGYCTSLKTSRDNCGACRAACLPSQLCWDGTCA